jgi:acetyl esterase/lipase
VGVDQIIVSGDSAGGCLAYHLLQKSRPIPDEIIASLFVSPFVDLSMTFPDKNTCRELGQTQDILPMCISQSCVNYTLFGHDDPSKDYHPIKMDPKVSPFFETQFQILPRPLVIFGHDEMFGPAIQDLVDRWRQTQPDVQVVAEPDVPHNYFLIASLNAPFDIPLGYLGRKSMETCDIVARHYFKAYQQTNAKAIQKANELLSNAK